jgi:DNA-binding response OmpR family regulator
MRSKGVKDERGTHPGGGAACPLQGSPRTWSTRRAEALTMASEQGSLEPVAKQNLLLVDADQRSLRVLEVSLRKAGYSVTTCADALTAIEMIGLSRPDMIISDTRLPEVDGFQLVERLRESEDSREIPFMFLSSDGSVESKVKGLELGVQDYLTKPIYIKEIITRVNLELQRRQRVGLERKSVETKTRFSGSLADMGLVDLLQTIDISRKSGVLHLTSPIGQRGAIYFDVGGLKHAELGKLRGEWALYRSLVWNEGNFELEFRPVRLEEETISMSTQGLLMEGMRRLDEWGRLLEQLPPLDAVFEIDEAELRDRLAEIPDEINDVLKYFDGVRSLMDVVDEVAKDDLETLAAISKLYFEGLIVDSGMRTSLLTPASPFSDTTSESGLDDSDHEMDEEAAAMAAAGVVPGESGDLLVSSGETPLEPEDFGQTLMPTSSLGPASLAGMRAADSEPPPARERPQRERSDTSPGIARGDIAQAQLDRDSAERAIGTLGDDEPAAQAAQADTPAAPAPDTAPAAAAEPPADSHADADGRPTAVDAAPASPANPEPPAAREDARPEPPAEAPTETPAEEPREVRAARTPAEPLPGNVIRFPQKGGAALALAEPEAEREEPPPETEEPLPVQDPAEEDSNKASKGNKPSASTGQSGAHARPSDPGVAAVVGVPVPEAEDSPARASSPASDSIPTRPQEGGHDASDFSDEFFVAESYESTRASQVVARPDRMADLAPEEADRPTPSTSDVAWRYLGLLTAAAVIVFFVYHLATRDREGRFGDIGQPAHVVTPDIRPTLPTQATATPEAPVADEAAADPQPEVAAVPDTAAVVDAGVAAVVDEVPPVAEAAPAAAAPSAALEEALTAARAARGRDAQAAWEAVLAIQPASAEALEELAWLAINRRQNPQARDYAQRAVAIDATLSRAWVTLGAALQELDDDAGARVAYQACVDHGEGRNVRDCRTMLRMLGTP